MHYEKVMIAGGKKMSNFKEQEEEEEILKFTSNVTEYKPSLWKLEYLEFGTQA